MFILLNEVTNFQEFPLCLQYITIFIRFFTVCVHFNTLSKIRGESIDIKDNNMGRTKRKKKKRVSQKKVPGKGGYQSDCRKRMDKES